jgi:phenylalanyl-tRNA synthetase beta chain
VPGMLDMLAWNLNRDVSDARLFEIGGVYQFSGGERVEPKQACLGATLTAINSVLPAAGALDVSRRDHVSENHASATEAFRGFKGDIENLLAAFSGEIAYDRETAAYFHPGRSARATIDGVAMAQFGQIHPEVAAARKLRQDVYLAEFDLEQLYRIGLRAVQFSPLAKYPAVERDFSFVFADLVQFIEMQKAVAKLGIPELRELRPVEIFRGGAIAPGQYSILLRVRFQSEERTLREDEVAQWSAKITDALTQVGGSQRI